MNEPDDKSSATKRGFGGTRFPSGSAPLRDSRTLYFAGACVLLVAGAFCIWQSWLIFSRDSGAAQIESVTTWQRQALEKFVADTRVRVGAAVDSVPVTTALAQGGDDARSVAAQAVKQALPDLVTIEFFRPDLNDVLSSDFAKFGYTKAALLVQSQHNQRGAPLQSQIDAQKKRHLIFALPVLHDKQTVAYAFVQLPYEPLQQLFRQPHLSDARMDLRQGDGRGDLLLESIGNLDTRSSLSDPGIAIPNSMFRIGSVPEEFYIALPDTLWVTLPLSLLLLAVAMLAFYARKVGAQAALDRLYGRKRASAGSEPTMAEALALAPATAKVAPAAAAEAKPAASKVPVDRSIFRAYDIRGVLGKTLNADIARQIGSAIGSEAQQRGLSEIVVARDGRLSGPELSAALIEGLRGTGCNVIDIGAVPTPVLYFATYHLNVGSGVMVTGSHNPPDYNGFKIVLGGETLAEDAIQALYTRISEHQLSTGNGGLQTMDVAHDYLERITGDVMVEHKLKVVVDCGNGIPGMLAPEVLEGVGCEVLPLYCDVDGTFPNHHPDPSEPQNLQDLILSVKQMNADLGLAFDGDGDRLGVVTASGEIIYPDRVLMLFAQDVLTRNPGAAIIYDVKCTGKLQPLILQAGGSPIMWKTGHSLIKAKMRETGAELAGEMSGHFFFRERWYGFDDGIYAAARLMEILASDPDGRNPQEIFDSLPKGVSTPELKIEMKEGEHYRFVERFREKSSFEGARVTTIDGVRADWSDGWGLVRASNTTPVLVLRFDADSDAAMARIQDTFRTQLLAIDPKLKLPF
ncbi:MAG: phosphomannomutase/phosphoglucomutase [Rudaea sp.]